MEDQTNVESKSEREHQWYDQWPSTGENAESPEELDIGDGELGFPESVGTSDASEASREAEPYMPPIDPPVLPGGDEGIHVATGFGQSAEEGAVREDRPRGDEDIRLEAQMTLQQDSLTSQYPLHVHVQDGVVRLHGALPSIDDAEHATWMLGNLPGVIDVIDDTELDTTLV